MEITCPSCRSKIPTDDINVSTDIALCRACNKPFHFSELLDGISTSSANLNAPPNGAWYEALPSGFRAGASTRSWMALFLVPFTCVWAGGSMAGIYGTQFAKGHFDPFASLFGVPFLLGSCFLVAFCAMNVAGKVTVTRNADQLTIFTGVGPLGWNRHFHWSDFTNVREYYTTNFRSWNRQGRSIILEGSRSVAFGSMLSQERRYFLLSAMRAGFRGTSTSPIFATAPPRFR